jgi:hypothetical protein
MHTTRRCEEELRGGYVRLLSLEPLAQRHNVDAKTFRKRREPILRELFAECQTISSAVANRSVGSFAIGPHQVVMSSSRTVIRPELTPFYFRERQA